ncbi:MAG TPA: ArsA family ATPase, partial [Acidimicrobiales bacterium]|nr:ArsA family ATPase [Acidimicrobiales bacterium]
LFTGKGGVGKTTVAAATALRCAERGLRTIVVSTDPAHSLADALDVALGPSATPVADRLWGQQLDAAQRMQAIWGDLQRLLVRVLDWTGARAIEAEELAVVPGLEEVFGLADIKALAESGDWDVVVVDCAPSAETLRLLSLPDVVGWYLDRLVPAGGVAASGLGLPDLVRPLLGAVPSLALVGDDAVAAVRRCYEALHGVRALLTDPARTAVRLVVNPERIVVDEARRMASYLGLYGYALDAVVVNRLLPDAVVDPWFKAWKEAQAEHLAEVENGFAPVPVLRSELAAEEPVGAERLRRLAEELYGAADPAGVLYAGCPLRVEARGPGATVLSMALPFTARGDVDLGRKGAELLVRVGPHRRAVVLPDSLRRRSVTGATMVGDRLEVSFAPIEERV